MPQIIPAIAPCWLIFLENIPMIRVGKKEDAANPKANATVLATKLEGGLMPK